MDNNEKFIVCFKELEDYLIKLCKKTDYLYQFIESRVTKSNGEKFTFWNCLYAINNATNRWQQPIALIKWLEVKINKIKEKYDFLDYVRSDRNKLSHEKWWFEITNEYLSELEALCDFLFRTKIKDTETVTKQVKSCNELDSLQDILEIMFENKFTHIPVISNTWEIIGVISDALITVWLRNQINDNGEIVLDTKSVNLWDVVKMKTRYEEYLVLSDRELTSIAYWKFEEFILKWNRLWCIIFTKDLNVNSSLTWIMTAWDLPIIKEYFML